MSEVADRITYFCAAAVVAATPGYDLTAWEVLMSLIQETANQYLQVILLDCFTLLVHILLAEIKYKII